MTRRQFKAGLHSFVQMCPLEDWDGCFVNAYEGVSIDRTARNCIGRFIYGFTSHKEANEARAFWLHTLPKCKAELKTCYVGPGHRMREGWPTNEAGAYIVGGFLNNYDAKDSATAKGYTCSIDPTTYKVVNAGREYFYYGGLFLPIDDEPPAIYYFE